MKNDRDKGELMIKRIVIFAVIPVIWVTSAAAFGAGWPKEHGAYIATSLKDTPAFPEKLDGYHKPINGMDYFGEEFASTGTLSADEYDGWVFFDDFPYASIHCTTGVYMLRWQLSDQSVKIRTTIGDVTKAGNAKAGSFGYVFGPSCTQPRFHFVSSEGKNKTDSVEIKYEVIFWKAK